MTVFQINFRRITQLLVNKETTAEAIMSCLHELLKRKIKSVCFITLTRRRGVEKVAKWMTGKELNPNNILLDFRCIKEIS